MTCSNLCPPGYFNTTVAGSSCVACHTWCLTCTEYSIIKCTSCNTNTYPVNSSSCFAYVAGDHFYGMANPCPDGYYGLQYTKSCVACPTGCTTCAFYLNWEMPGTNFASTYNQNNTSCTGDVKCSYALKCFSCNSGYTNISGICVSNNECFTYSKYNSSSGGSFSSANCMCFSYFQSLGQGICQLCSINCLTCSSSSSSACTSCPSTAFTGSSCTFNTTLYMQVVNWGTSTPNLAAGPSGGWSINTSPPRSGVVQGDCNSSRYVFGYYGYNL
jgi:hypothetical protein